MGDTQQKLEESLVKTMGDTQQKLEESLVNLEKAEEDESGEAERSIFTCEICVEPMSSVEKFNSRDRCLHPFCTDCLAKYIQEKVEDNVAYVKCPALNCNQLLDPHVCRTIISAKLFNKWCDCLCDASLLAFLRCYCPNKYCSALVINECGGAVKKSKCPKCKQFFCFTCKVPWHAGFWCSETQQNRDANDVAFGVLLEKYKWNRCPQCGQAVERTYGCRIVICRCRFEFCHDCGEIVCECPLVRVQQVRQVRQVQQVQEEPKCSPNRFGCCFDYIPIGIAVFVLYIYVSNK